MSPAACAGSSPGPRSELLGAAELLCVFSETTPAPLGVQVGLVLKLKAADLGAVFFGALLRDVGRGTALAPFFAGQELARRLDDLWLCGVTERASWPQNPAPSCGSGMARLRVPVDRRIARPGSCRPASRTNGRGGQRAARRIRDASIPGACAVGKE
jgi:hypothetical protein